MKKFVEYFKSNTVKLIATILGFGVSVFCMIFFNVEVHKACPFATVCNGTLLFEKGKLFFMTGIGIGLAIIVLSYFLSRLYCGYVCPIGYLQKFSMWGAKKFKIKPMKLKETPIKWLTIMKYVLTMILIVAITISGSMLFIDFCPVFMIASYKYIGASLFTIGFTLFIMVAAMKIEYFFCRFLCPYSTLLEGVGYIFEKMGFKRIRNIKRDEESCISCNLCDKNCPMGVEVTKGDEVQSHLCIGCMTCVDSCPMNKKGKDTLKY